MEKEYKFNHEIGDTIITDHVNMTIIGKEIRDRNIRRYDKMTVLHKRYYQYKCNICGNIDWIAQPDLDNAGRGCNVCRNLKVLKGYNDIATTVPWMTNLFENIEDAYTHVKYSKDSVNFKCPDCGRIHNRVIASITAAGKLTCPCNDTWSYPNKFMAALLGQLDLDYICEKNFSWSDRKIYDDYIEFNGKKIITEQHGKQHYLVPYSNSTKARTVEEEQKNDILKRELAMANGIDYYFEINCSVSTKEYIAKSIIDSGLLTVLNVNSDSIDWDKCAEFCMTNLGKVVCQYKKDHPELAVSQIAEHFHIGYQKTLNMVRKGAELGWCDYIRGEDSKKLRISNSYETRQRPIHCITTGMYFSNAVVLSECMTNDKTSFHAKTVQHYTHINKKYKGYSFEYITKEEFNRIKTESPEIAFGDFIYIKKRDAA